MATRGKYYVVRIPSWKGSDTWREQYSLRGPREETYAILSVLGSKAAIVDDGYRDATEAKKAWPEALYEAGGR